MELVVALLQLLPTGTLEGNLEKGLFACRKARSMGADVALFPEMWSTGYQFPPQGDGPAIPKDHSFLQAFQSLARELSMAIGITYLEEFSPLPRNSFALFDFQGRRVLDYAKVHTCDFGDEYALTPGDSFPVTTLKTPKGPVQVGCMICYDREFPESARLLMLGGAEIILTPNACPWRSTAFPSCGAGPMKICWASPQSTIPWGIRTATVIPPPLTAWPIWNGKMVR